MILVESFESAGLWWLPDTPDEQVVGLLRYSDADGFELSIPFGHLGGMKHMVARVNESESTAVVRGVLRNGKHVTLENVLMTNMTVSIPGAGSEEYYAGLGFVGELEAGAIPAVDRVRLAFTHLRDWVVDHPSASELAIDNGKLSQRVDYHYESPEPERLASGDGWELLILHKASIPFVSLTGFNVTHDCEIELRLDPPLAFEQISTEYIGPLWRFLVFCLDRDVANTSLRIRPPGENDWLDVGRHQSLLASEDKVISAPFMLLSRPQLGDRAASVLSTWLALSDDERRAVSLLTDLIRERAMSSDLRFLVAAQGLETLSRVDAKEFELKSEEFERRLEVVSASIEDSKVRKWATRKLKYANERPASELLRDLADGVGEYVAKIAPDQKSLFADIRNNRNFYTHRDPRRAKHVLDGEELYVLTQAVVLLLKAATLRNLGFTEEETSAIMEACQGALQWRFRTAKQYVAKALPD